MIVEFLLYDNAKSWNIFISIDFYFFRIPSYALLLSF
jgi:hypothetical protein